jgi:hypothetical protein
MDTRLPNQQCHLTNYLPNPSTSNHHLRRSFPLIKTNEVGWPSGGGSVNSSVAGIDEMQYFINHFLSAAKNADVSYYYFEGYDEPWKIIFDTATEQYEDKWVSLYNHNADVGITGCKWVFKGWDHVA